MTIMRPPKNSKSILLIFIITLTWAGMVYLILVPWLLTKDHPDIKLDPILIIGYINAMIWWIVMLWVLHHLCYQIVTLFQKKDDNDNLVFTQLPTVAILYLTYNDFNVNCCQSALNQDYLSKQFCICDDSTRESSKQEIDDFCSLHPESILLRRKNRTGYKAGNINYAVKNINADWVLLVDSDQTLPENYLSNLIRHLPINKDSVAYVQASHRASTQSNNSPFQTALSPEVSLLYSRNLTARMKYGFVPLLGHGALINRIALEKVGYFPEVVSEDFAFAMQCVSKGWHGHYIETVESEELYPSDFGGFLLRLRKFSSGAAELIFGRLFSFLMGKGTFVEKWDLVFMLLWYVLMPLLVFNSFLGAVFVHALWVKNFSYLHPILPYLYIWMFAANISISASSIDNLEETVKFYFWSTAIYTAVLPLTSASFLASIFVKPKFRRTPKNGEKTRLKILDSIFMIILGFLALFYSFKFLSPFSPFLAGQGIAYLCFPIFNKLNSDSFVGRIARFLVYLPGSAMIFSLFAMLWWGR